MSNVPYVPPGTQVVVQPQPSNGLGVAGFVTSLIGVVTCGVLSPIGLLFSLIGLAKRPRGLAIAGTILGALGTAWLVAAGFAMVAGFVGLKNAVNTAAGMITTQSEARLAADTIVQERAQKGGTLPAENAGNELIKGHVDAWKNRLRYKPSGQTFKIVSDGPDGEPDTSDDFSFTEAELRQPAFGTTRPGGDINDDLKD